eukprot:Tamp_07981.p1 GENE.Tamp_07981~~Tamp_07981.p1  ORF type:complete len:705 (+),score=99.56 Tamp_07981:106-2220(+)
MSDPHAIVSEMEADHDDFEEGVQPGQTMLTEFFQTRFKGSSTSKQALFSSKQSALSGAGSGPGVGVQANASHTGAAADEKPTTPSRTVVQPSVNARLLDRIKSAQTVPEAALEELCCHKVVSQRRSVGVRVLLRQSTPPRTVPLLATQASRPQGLAGSASQSDWTQLDPAAAIRTVKEAASSFGKQVFTVRRTEHATSRSSSGGRTVAERYDPSSLSIDQLQCHEHMQLDSHGFSDGCSMASRSCSSPVSTREVWLGMTSTQASLQSSPYGKPRADRLRTGSERPDREAGLGLLAPMQHHLMETRERRSPGMASEGRASEGRAPVSHAASVASGTSAAASEDEHGRKRHRNGSVSSLASAESELIDVDEFLCAPSSSPNRPQSAAMAAARAPSSPPRGRPGGTSAHGSRQRGGGFAALNIKRSPSASSRASGPHRSPPRGGDGGCAGSSGRRDASFSARKRPKVQIRYDTSGQDHGSFPSLQRSCVVQPFGLIKPSSPAGERTLRSLNNVIMQTNLRKQQMGYELSSASSTYSQCSSVFLSHMCDANAPPAGGDKLQWGSNHMDSVPPHSPPRHTENTHDEEAAMAALMCDENLQDDSALYLSPRREEVHHTILSLAPNSAGSGTGSRWRQMLSGATSGPRSGSVNVAAFLASPFSLNSPSRALNAHSPSRCGVSLTAQHGTILHATAELDAQCLAAANVITTP